MVKRMRDRDSDQERREKHSDRKQKEKQRSRETEEERVQRLGRKQVIDTTGKTDQGLDNQVKDAAQQATQDEDQPETQSPQPGERKTRDTDMQEQSDGLHAAADRARTDAIEEEDEGLLDDQEEFNRRLREEGADAVIRDAAAERTAALEEARKKREAQAKSDEE